MTNIYLRYETIYLGEGLHDHIYSYKGGTYSCYVSYLCNHISTPPNFHSFYNDSIHYRVQGDKYLQTPTTPGSYSLITYDPFSGTRHSSTKTKKLIF